MATVLLLSPYPDMAHTLLERTVRVAHLVPALRPHLLPLIRQAVEDADERYEDRSREADKLLREVGSLLKEHRKEQKKDPRNWGYVGDLGSVIGDLEGIRAFLSSNKTPPSRTAARPVQLTQDKEYRTLKPVKLVTKSTYGRDGFKEDAVDVPKGEIIVFLKATRGWGSDPGLDLWFTWSKGRVEGYLPAQFVRYNTPDPGVLEPLDPDPLPYKVGDTVNIYDWRQRLRGEVTAIREDEDEVDVLVYHPEEVPGAGPVPRTHTVNLNLAR